MSTAETIDQSNDDIPQYTLIKPQLAKVPLWKYFRQYAPCDNRKEYAVCTLCHEKEIDDASSKRRRIDRDKYEVKYVGSTGKLTRHLRTHHKTEHELIEMSKTSGKGISEYFKKKSDSKKKLIKFMVMTFQPISLVENAYFREFITSLSDNIQHCGREHIKNELSENANIVRNRIAEKIKNKKVALTGDKWSSVSHQSYLGLTCHYIDDDWKLNS